MRSFPVALTLLLAAVAAAADVPLEAGLARVEITPAGSMPMYGYNNRKCGPSNGTHDPLYAKALVLRTGETRIAIVTLDIGNFYSARLRRKVADELGIPVLLLAASHTHSGPQFMMDSPDEVRARYREELEAKVFGAVRDAAKAMFPARLGTGRGSLQVGYNRLLPRDDGRSRALFENPDRIPYGPVDPEYAVLRVEDAATGAARAVIAHYACHAVVLGPTNCKYSADWPGAMQAKVEAELPGVQCMFVQGGAGDINPLSLARSGKEDDDFAVVKKLGDLMGTLVAKTAKAIPPAPANREPIRYASDVLTFGDRWDAKGKPVEVGITTVLIDRRIAIAAVPGEPFHKIQTLWKEKADVPVALFYGYTSSVADSWPGYLPDLKSAAYGGYGADVTTKAEIGAGERVIERHVVNLYRLLGMWQEKPGRP